MKNLENNTLIYIDQQDDKIIMVDTSFNLFEFYHSQSCCENVYIESVTGDWKDLIGHPLLMANIETSDDDNNAECGMWTFYKFATIKGYVDVRWYGSSNGYYSVEVSLLERKLQEEPELFKKVLENLQMIVLPEINDINESARIKKPKV